MKIKKMICGLMIVFPLLTFTSFTPAFADIFADGHDMVDSIEKIFRAESAKPNPNKQIIEEGLDLLRKFRGEQYVQDNFINKTIAVPEEHQLAIPDKEVKQISAWYIYSIKLAVFLGGFVFTRWLHPSENVSTSDDSCSSDYYYSDYSE
jgi:hypothetical protein